MGNLRFVSKVLEDDFGFNEIGYKVDPISHWMQGRTIFGFLHYSKDNGCSSFKIDSALKPKDIPYFLLMDAANCSTDIQAMNTENSDAQMLIVIDDSFTPHKYVAKKPVNRQVKIPVLVISSETGSKLKGMLKKFGDFILKYQFTTMFMDMVKLDFFIDENDTKNLEFLQSLEGIYKSFGKHLSLNFHLYASKDPDYKDQISKLEIFINCLNGDLTFHYIQRLNVCLVQEKETKEKWECFASEVQKDFPD